MVEELIKNSLSKPIIKLITGFKQVINILQDFTFCFPQIIHNVLLHLKILIISLLCALFLNQKIFTDEKNILRLAGAWKKKILTLSHLFR